MGCQPVWTESMYDIAAPTLHPTLLKGSSWDSFLSSHQAALIQCKLHMADVCRHTVHVTRLLIQGLWQLVTKQEEAL